VPLYPPQIPHTRVLDLKLVCVLRIYPDNEGSSFLRNARKNSQTHTASNPKRSSYLLHKITILKSFHLSLASSFLYRQLQLSKIASSDCLAVDSSVCPWLSA